MSSRGRTASRAGASASRSSSSTSTSSGQASASTSSSGTSSSGAGAARSSRSSSSVSVSSPTGSKTVTTTKTTTPTETKKETTAQPKTPITVSADLAKAISDSQQAYPEAWTEATGTQNIQKQFEQVTGTTITPIIVEAPEEDITIPELPEITIPEIPEAMAEQEQVLADDIVQILNDINNGVILVPDWFRNNIEWVKNGHITQQEFRTAYNYLTDTQIIHAPEENLAISDNMITQKVNYFSIINGRAKGEITFTITDSFNPYYFNKNIVNLIQFKTPNGINILPVVKQNTLRFTQTERDETIQYDEDMQGNTRATVESFVWDSTLSQPFSKVFSIEISATEPPKPISSGFMAMGAAGAIAGLVLLGFIVDHKRGK